MYIHISMCIYKCHKGTHRRVLARLRLLLARGPDDGHHAWSVGVSKYV